MIHSVLYQITRADYRDMTDDATCEGWQGWTAAMVDAGALKLSTVEAWPCPNCNRKGCKGEAKRSLPLLSIDLPTRARRLAA